MVVGAMSGLLVAVLSLTCVSAARKAGYQNPHFAAMRAGVRSAASAKDGPAPPFSPEATFLVSQFFDGIPHSYRCDII